MPTQLLSLQSLQRSQFIARLLTLASSSTAPSSYSTVVEGFFDISKLVASDAKAGKTPYEDLAYKARSL